MLRSFLRSLAVLAMVALVGLPASAQTGGLSARPDGLRVDAAGNGGMEPGESVVVAPRWMNDGLLSLGNLTGTAVSFTGPGTGTYVMDTSWASTAWWW